MCAWVSNFLVENCSSVVWCEKHVNAQTQPEEIFDYSHVAGRAVLHHGRHRHGARATTSGHRINLLLWCRSSVFRELRKRQKDLSSWCTECQRKKKERQRQRVAAIKLELEEEKLLRSCLVNFLVLTFTLRNMAPHTNAKVISCSSSDFDINVYEIYG